MKSKSQKLYCYVDESGQDTKSDIFVVVTVVNDAEQSKIRNDLLLLEKQTQIGIRKWHKTTAKIKYQFLEEQMERKILTGNIFFGRFAKPLPYFLPIIEVIEKSVKYKAEKNYSCIIYIDSIDKRKAKELTNALRYKNIHLSLIKSRKDESEPIIRLADRWAGYIRSLQFIGITDTKLFTKAIKNKSIIEITKNLPTSER